MHHTFAMILMGGFDIIPRKNVDIEQAVSMAGMVFGFALEIWV